MICATALMWIVVGNETGGVKKRRGERRFGGGAKMLVEGPTPTTPRYFISFFRVVMVKRVKEERENKKKEKKEKTQREAEELLRTYTHERDRDRER